MDWRARGRILDTQVTHNSRVQLNDVVLSVHTRVVPESREIQHALVKCDVNDEIDMIVLRHANSAVRAPVALLMDLHNIGDGNVLKKRGANADASLWLLCDSVRPRATTTMPRTCKQRNLSERRWGSVKYDRCTSS